MNNTHPDETGLATQRDVITLCDYGTCPTIKSNNAIDTMIVVKSDGNMHSIKARTDDIDHDRYEPFENRTLGVLLQ